MKIPKYIKESIKRGYKSSLIVQNESEKVRDWLNKNNLPECFVDSLIDTVELGLSEPDAFIKELEDF